MDETLLTLMSQTDSVENTLTAQTTICFSHLTSRWYIRYFYCIATTWLLFESSSLWLQTPLPHIKPFLSPLRLYVQVTQRGCCMTRTASLWTWPPSSQRRKAWWWTSLPSKRRKRQHRWGDGRRSGGTWRKPSVFNDCLFEFGRETPLSSVLCPLPWEHILPRVSVLQYCTVSQNHELCTCCLNEPSFTLQRCANPLFDFAKKLISFLVYCSLRLLSHCCPTHEWTNVCTHTGTAAQLPTRWGVWHTMPFSIFPSYPAMYTGLITPNMIQ